jgi:hypothetical protein
MHPVPRATRSPAAYAHCPCTAFQRTLRALNEAAAQACPAVEGVPAYSASQPHATPLCRHEPRAITRFASLRTQLASLASSRPACAALKRSPRPPLAKPTAAPPRCFPPPALRRRCESPAARTAPHSRRRPLAEHGVLQRDELVHQARHVQLAAQDALQLGLHVPRGSGARPAHAGICIYTHTCLCICIYMYTCIHTHMQARLRPALGGDLGRASERLRLEASVLAASSEARGHPPVSPQRRRRRPSRLRAGPARRGAASQESAVRSVNPNPCPQTPCDPHPPQQPHSHSCTPRPHLHVPQQPVGSQEGLRAQLRVQIASQLLHLRTQETKKRRHVHLARRQRRACRAG